MEDLKLLTLLWLLLNGNKYVSLGTELSIPILNT